MTTAAALANWDRETAFSCARMQMQVFTVYFCEFFRGPVSRWVPRALKARASAFLRTIAAMTRSIMLVEAAALASQLPAPRPLAARSAAPVSTPTPEPTPEPAPAAQRAPGFGVFRAADFAFPVRRIAGAPQGPRPTPAALVDFSPIGRRFEALHAALENPEAHVRRLALRLRAVKARGERLQIFASPRVHPDQEVHIARDLDIFREDANDALRALLWNSS